MIEAMRTKTQKEWYEAPAMHIMELSTKAAIAQVSGGTFPVGGDGGFGIAPGTGNDEIFKW